MNKTLKYGLIFVGALLVVFLALIALVAATFNPNDYKPLIVKLVQEKKQRTLKLEGDIKLTFFPRIGADLGKLSLSDHGSDKEFAAIDSARVSLALLPLLKKQLVVDRIRIDGVRARLVRYPDGSTSIDDLLKKEEEESEQFKFDIKGVSITRAAFSFDDRMAERKLDISGLEFESGRLANNQPGKIDLKFTLQGDKPKINAQVALASGLLFDIEAKAVTLDGLTVSLAGKRGDGGMEISLTSPKFELGPERVAGKLDLTAKMTQAKGNLNLALSVPALTGKGNVFRAETFTLDVNGQQGENIIKSRLASPFSANLDTHQFSLDKLVASFDLSGPAMAKALDVNLGGVARIDLDKQDAHLDLSGRLDESKLKAKLGISHFDAPAYDFDIVIDQLDIDRYLPPGRPEDKARQPEKPLDFSFLKNLNANGRLSIGALKVANIKSSNIKLNVKADGGNLNVAPISANFYQGTLNGAISLHDAGTPRVALKQNLVGVSVGPMLKDVANVDMLEGHGSVALDVSGQGTTVSAMKKALQGSAALNLQNGALKGVNIAGAIRNAKAKFGSLQGESTQAANAADKTDFSELKASFQINNGVAHNEDLSAKSPLLRLAGNGDVNIGESSMNYLAKATVVASLEGQGGKELSALKGMTVPVRITGPFTGLKYSLDFNAMASEAVKQKVEQKKEEIKSRLGEELKSGLKGLFK
ncbi:AsmA family protein [Sulfuricella denitrificans skB26]|uniref:AsmA family protein n=1 Tax=Sulfuricella denitrificans (strain DSM 22764 / NBRC 105220 / skB26) TaxID=1163617 RepID=S6B109_SULDS|nr:AsmA family protein [Sulfuricella denitrificans]BAN34382.1 AsmA family protein [Sulfuricella denitrificans skB26]